MNRLLALVTLALLLALVGLSPSAAQQKKDDLDKFREAFSKPKTALDFWNALSFELDVGRTDLAAGHLKALLGHLKALPANMRGADLLKIVDQEGMTEVLKLRNVPIWFAGKDKDSQKKDQEAKDNVRELIRQVTAANAERLKDVAPVVREHLKQLLKTKEEREYAQRELAKLGATAVPEMIAGHLRATEAAERQAVIQALGLLGPGALPPILAALDSDNLLLKLDLLDVLRNKHARSGRAIVPHLWALAASPKQPELVRKKAGKLLANFLDLDETRLPPAKVALVREAERYYKGEATPPAVLWRWDGKRLVQGWPEQKPPVTTVSADQATAYYGLRYAQQALGLDPTYRPAQVVLLSLAVDKAGASPAVAELVGRAGGDLLLEVLERALADKKSAVVLRLVQALGDRAEVRAKRPLAKGEPALVRALSYPDPRVQLAAAEALLRIPGEAPPRARARIVEVLKNALAPATTQSPGRKVLVAVADEDWRTKVGNAVTALGATPVAVTNGRDALRRLKASGEIEAVLFSSDLPHPGLAHTLAQLYADRDITRVPVLIAAVPQTRAAVEAARSYERLRDRRDALTAETVTYRSQLSQLDADERKARKEVEDDRTLKADERLKAYTRIEEKYAEERGRTADRHRGEARLYKDLPRIEAQIAAQERAYDREVAIRESSLSRFVTRYPGTKVVHASLLTDGRALGRALEAESKGGGFVVQSPADRQAAAERAITLLAQLAAGRPAGYDITPASDAILTALRNGRLAEPAQLAAIQAAARLPGAKAQRELGAVVRSEARGAAIRAAAAEALLVSIARQGRLLTLAEVKSLQEVSTQKGVDARLKGLIDQFTGALSTDDKRTGERLRDYRFVPGR